MCKFKAEVRSEVTPIKSKTFFACNVTSSGVTYFFLKIDLLRVHTFFTKKSVFQVLKNMSISYKFNML